MSAAMKYAEFGSVVQLRVQLNGIRRAPRVAKSLHLPISTHIRPVSFIRFYRPVYAEMRGAA